MAGKSKKHRLETIRERIKGFPAGPGLYFMKGPKDVVLYIGKAKNLRLFPDWCFSGNNLQNDAKWVILCQEA